ncbi:MAG: hypothetical protein IKS20_04530 [Victivallales bacterium]|nr:hypothetical protein [Victivallales bacterium]
MPRHRFEKTAEANNSNRHCKHFTAWRQLDLFGEIVTLSFIGQQCNRLKFLLFICILSVYS